ncbi:MAG: hypothetical protein AAGD25_02690 [Cyanobacteria bacterium P01_F01_bin.150]
MKKILSALTTASLLMVSLESAIAHPQPSTSLAQKSLDCSIVENLGNSLDAEILAQVNERVSGESHRISKRKKLIINQVESVSFQACELTIELDATLKRKIRQNAHGTITLRSTIDSFNLPEREVCYTDLRVSNVSLSRTLNIGERVYEWAANRALPDSGCLSE